MTSDKDYAMPRHGQDRGFLHAGFEIRQDLVESESGQGEWAREDGAGAARVAGAAEGVG